MDESILIYVLTFLIVILAARMYITSESFQLKCVISDVDGEVYCVRDREKLKLVADKLARTTGKLKELVIFMNEKYPERENVKRLVKNFNPKKIMETLPTSKHTAYSENKGEKIAFCVTREKEGDDTLIDDGTLMFVALHEISHVATKSIGHNDEFWTNFKFILTVAKEAGIYDPVDYKKKPERYCGMNISDNPYFDY